MATNVLNGAELAIVSNRFEGIARKMSNTLLRTGRSGVLNRAKDFSCCIVNHEHELVAAAESLPIHVLIGPDMMAAHMKQVHPLLRRGDAFLNNSPYHGCSHPADHTLLVPVIDDKGNHRFTVLAKAHQADIGNSSPTTYMGDALDVYNEGALIFPSTQVQRDYADIEDIIRMCELRIRVPEQWRGDFLAMVGAARIGEQEIMNLAKELGWDFLQSYTQQWFDYSEKRMIDAISTLPSGQVAGYSTHDPFPGTPEEGVTITSTVKIDSEEGRIEIDLTENPDVMKNGLNVSESCTRTSALVGVFNSIDHTVPKNAGSFRRVDINLREGCVVGYSCHPYSHSASTTNLADRIANGIQSAIAEFAEGFGMGEAGAIQPPSMAVVSGYDPRSDRDYINQLFLGIHGGPAGPKADAWWNVCHVGNAGMCLTDSVEQDEYYHPMIVHRRQFVRDSEGAGKHVGAPSIAVEYGPIDAPMNVVFISDGFKNPPKGVRGGGSGGSSDQFKCSAEAGRVRLPGYCHVQLEPDETIISVGCGGGGYGSPLERPPEKVAEAVAENLVSAARALEVYGVALSAAGGVDESATQSERESRGKRSSRPVTH